MGVKKMLQVGANDIWEVMFTQRADKVLGGRAHSERSPY